MRKLLLPGIVLAFSLAMVGSTLAEFQVDAQMGEGIKVGPQALPDLIVYKGYTSKDHLSFEPTPANDFTIGVDELNCNVFVYVKSAPLTATYTLILKRLDAPGFKIYKTDYLIEEKGKWRLTLYWATCPDLPGQWRMIPIVKSSTGSHIPYNPKALYDFTIHY